MRELTFKGFLKRYVKELSHQHTNNIYKLVKETANENPRLYEPLILYANLNSKNNELLMAVSNEPNFDKRKLQDYMQYTSQFQNIENISLEYKKVHNSYLYYKNKLINENHTKELMYNKIMKLKSEKNITNYKIYHNLSINSGNFNTFIKNKQLSKCSIKTLRIVIDYLENY
jgi:hypothetical protein